MYLPSTFESMSEQYPKEMERVMQKLRSGKSKHRLAEMKDLTWGFDYCIEIRGGAMSFADILSGKPKPQTESIPHYAVEGSIGKWRGAVSINSVPKEAVIANNKSEDDDQLEQIKHDSLSPQERSDEINRALKELSKYPGFVAIGVK